MAESKEELKSLLMKVKQGEWKSWLKTQHSKSKDHGIWSHHFSRIDGETMETVRYFIFLGSKITADSDCSHKIKRHLLAPWKKSCDQPRQHIKKQRHYFANNGLSSQSYVFSGSHVHMWKVDHKEGWVLENWWLWIVLLEETLENPLDCKEIKPSQS